MFFVSNVEAGVVTDLRWTTGIGTEHTLLQIVQTVCSSSGTGGLKQQAVMVITRLNLVPSSTLPYMD